MAVVFGGSAGARVAWDAGVDSPADRLLALAAQEGSAYVLFPDRGAILTRRVGLESVEIQVGVSVFTDGVVSGGNTLTSVSAPFESSMLGMSLVISGFGRRTITSFTSASQVGFSGPAIPNAGGYRFTAPTGTSLFTDGQTGSLAGTVNVMSGTPDNKLVSASAPFKAGMVGRRVSIATIGSRVITAFVSANEVTIDGPAIPAGVDRPFTVPVFVEQAERQIKAGSKVLDSHRTPAMNTPTIVRWRIG